MRMVAECPRCREVAERRQSMHEVGSERRSQALDVVSLKEMDAADVHSGKLTLCCSQGHERGFAKGLGVSRWVAVMCGWPPLALRSHRSTPEPI
jgi:hypothetical protein